MTARTSSISITVVSLFGVFLVSCGSAEQSTSGTDVLTNGSASSSPSNSTPSISAPANQELYLGYKVVCQDDSEEAVLKNGSSEALTQEAEAICAKKGTNKETGKRGINSLILKQSPNDANAMSEAEVVEEEIVAVETVYTGFYVLCQNGSTKTKEIQTSLEALYQEAETFCAGKADRRTGKSGIAKYSALDALNPAPSPSASPTPSSL